MAGTPSVPQLRDPVVVDGVKYRIRSIGADGVAQLKTHFGDRRATAAVADLVYDRRAGVWRVAPSS